MKQLRVVNHLNCTQGIKMAASTGFQTSAKQNVCSFCFSNDQQPIGLSCIHTTCQGNKSSARQLTKETRSERNVELYRFDNSYSVSWNQQILDLTSMNDLSRCKTEEWMLGSGAIRSSVESVETRILIDSFSNQCNAIQYAIDRKRSEIAAVNTMESEIKHKINMQRDMIDYIISQYVKQILLELSGRTSKAVDILQNDIDFYEWTATRARTELEGLQNLKKPQKADTVLLERATKQYEKLQLQLSCFKETSAPGNFSFSLDPAIERFLNDCNSFGSLVSNSIKPIEAPLPVSVVKKAPKTTSILSGIIDRLNVFLSGERFRFVMFLLQLFWIICCILGFLSAHPVVYPGIKHIE